MNFMHYLAMATFLTGMAILSNGGDLRTFAADLFWAEPTPTSPLNVVVLLAGYLNICGLALREVLFVLKNCCDWLFPRVFGRRQIFNYQVWKVWIAVIKRVKHVHVLYSQIKRKTSHSTSFINSFTGILLLFSYYYLTYFLIPVRPYNILLYIKSFFAASIAVYQFKSCCSSCCCS